MGTKQEQDVHIQNAYEAALTHKANKQLAMAYARYKRNTTALLQNPNPKPCDFEGCVE